MISELPPGPTLPPLLQLIWMWTRPSAAILRLRRYGRRATVRLPFQPPLVVLSDPDEIREVFAADPEVLHPGEGSRILEPILGRNSVILLDEDAHMEQRRLLLPAFHGERMQQLAGLMVELTEAELAGWPTDEPVRLHPRLQRLTLEIVLRAVFGLEPPTPGAGNRGSRLDDLRTAVTEVLAFAEHPVSVVPAAHTFARWLPVLRRFRRASARADELIFAEVRERRAALHAGATPGSDILSTLLSARHEPDGTEMGDQELRDELLTALVAGHETTASQLAWAFAHLAREPRIAARLSAELDADDGDEYLTATVQEILRLRPVLPSVEPRLTQRRVRIGGFEYPPGVALMAVPFLVHHDPELYPQPFEFRPERFLGVTPGGYTWIPFGGGRRRCIGAAFAQQEMKIVLGAVLRRFTFEPADPRPERTVRRSITFSPSRGATVILHARRPNGYQSARGSNRGDQAVRPLPAAASLAGDPAGGR
jgi:cytochrome P450